MSSKGTLISSIEFLYLYSFIFPRYDTVRIFPINLSFRHLFKLLFGEGLRRPVMDTILYTILSSNRFFVSREPKPTAVVYQCTFSAIVALDSLEV